MTAEYETAPEGGDPGDTIYCGGPLVVERVGPDIKRSLTAFSLNDGLWPDWVFDGRDRRSDFDIWYGYQDQECVYSGPFESLMTLIDQFKIDQVRSPNGDIFRRVRKEADKPDLMASIRTIARGG